MPHLTTDAVQVAGTDSCSSPAVAAPTSRLVVRTGAKLVDSLDPKLHAAAHTRQRQHYGDVIRRPFEREADREPIEFGDAQCRESCSVQR